MPKVIRLKMNWAMADRLRSRYGSLKSPACSVRLDYGVSYSKRLDSF